MPDVRCADCAFLAAQLGDPPDLIEVDGFQREKWRPLKFVGNRPASRFALFPVCFMRVRHFERDLGGLAENVDAAIHQGFQCPSFTPWQQGFSPKEHREMQLAENLQRIQAEEREKDRAWRERQDVANRRWQFKLAILAAGFTLLNGFMTWLLTYLSSRGR